MAFSYARPDADSADGGWSNQAGSQTNLYASIDETVADDADYISSSPGNNNDVVKLSLSDVSSVSNPTTVRYRYKKNSGGDPTPVNMQAILLQGSTVIASWQHNDISTSYTLAEQSLSSGQFSAISDLTNLFLQFQTTWWLTDASIDLDLSNARYYDSSNPTVAVTDFLSCSRASIGYAQTAAGTLTQFGNDTLRITDLGLLVEDARTNYVLYSQEFDNTSVWTPTNTVTITANNTTAPDGTATADKIEATGSDSYLRQQVGGGILPTGTFIFSIYLRADTPTSLILKIIPNEVVSVNVDVTTSWQLFSLVYVSTLGGSFTLQIGGDSTFTTGEVIYAWGAQFELGAFPSSYIPTTTAAATRAFDQIKILGTPDTIIKANTGTIVADVQHLYSSATGVQYIIGEGNGGDNLLARYTNTQVSGTGYSASEGDFAATGLTFTGGVKVGQAWNSGVGGSIVGGGGTVGNNTGWNVTGHGDAYLGGYGANVTFYGYFRRLTVWNTKLADATLQALTAP